MAGAIPISLRPAEGEMVRSLNDVRLSLFLTVLDELDWCAARSLLPTLADLQQADNVLSQIEQQRETLGDTP
jgi:hypothetical protein